MSDRTAAARLLDRSAPIINRFRFTEPTAVLSLHGPDTDSYGSYNNNNTAAAIGLRILIHSRPVRVYIIIVIILTIIRCSIFVWFSFAFRAPSEFCILRPSIINYNLRRPRRRRRRRSIFPGSLVRVTGSFFFLSSIFYHFGGSPAFTRFVNNASAVSIGTRYNNHNNNNNIINNIK